MISTFHLAALRENSLIESTQKLQGRSQPPQASQLDLLALLEKSLEPALRIEPVPAAVVVGKGERFCLVHQSSQLRIPGQFSYYEAQEILELTAGWDWEVNPVTRKPGCRYQLLNLLNRICKPQTQEVAYE